MRTLTWLTRRITADRVAWTVAILSGMCCFGVLTAAAFFPAPGREPWLHEWFTVFHSPDQGYTNLSFRQEIPQSPRLILLLALATLQVMWLWLPSIRPAALRRGMTRFAALQSLMLLLLGIEFAGHLFELGLVCTGHYRWSLYLLCEQFHPTKWLLLWYFLNTTLLASRLREGLRIGRWFTAIGLAGFSQGIGLLLALSYLYYRAGQ